MSVFRAQTDAVLQWVRDLSTVNRVYFPMRNGMFNYSFEEVHEGSELQLEDYRPSVVPPIKKMLPARDNLVAFEMTPDGAWHVHNSLDESERILFALRPCDLKAIDLMDQVFSRGIADPYYLARREKTTIIAVGCNQPCDERAFCDAVGSLDHERGADVMMTPLDGGFLIEPLTLRGQSLLESTTFKPIEGGSELKQIAKQQRPEPFGRKFGFPMEQVAKRVQDNWDSDVWDRHVEDCFSCGTCNLVCPTCYCFDVADEMDLTGASGRRARTWDGCMLPQFASVAGGHNFRPDPAGRQRHRVKRKFQYLSQQFGGESFCVGCGRCGRQCTADIDIFDIVSDLVKEEVSA